MRSDPSPELPARIWLSAQKVDLEAGNAVAPPTAVRISPTAAPADFGVLILAVVGAWLVDTRTRDLRDGRELRQQSDRLRLTGPHGPPQLVPPRAPGPGVNT
jgi:hypothetical protein